MKQSEETYFLKGACSGCDGKGCDVCNNTGSDTKNFVQLNIRNLTFDERRRFKKFCMEHEIHMMDAVKRLMVKAVEGQVELN